MSIALHKAKKGLLELAIPELRKVKSNLGGRGDFEIKSRICHVYLMDTQPDYVAFVEALKPFSLPDWAK
jgi:hypothetical protein